MSASTGPHPAPAISRQWQFPLLLVSGALFVTGILRVMPAAVVPTFEDEVRDIRALIAAGKFTQAHDQLVKGFKTPPHRPDTEMRVLHVLMAEAIHGAESESGTDGAQRTENAARIIAHLRTAERMGAKLEAHDWARLSDGLEWAQRRAEATGALRRALAGHLSPSGSARRRLIGWLEEARPVDKTGVERELNSLLMDETARPDELHWALVRRVDLLLENKSPQAAATLLDRIGPRLNGTAYKAEVGYQRARCLLAEGHAAEAERILRELREAWNPRDDLWARTGILLARIQQDDGRPEAAMSFYDEVGAVFKSGPRHMECLTGRAQSLTDLERYDEARDAYAELIRLSKSADSHVDRDLLRAALTSIAANLNSRQRPQEGVVFLHMARALAAGGNADQQAAYASEEAELSLSLAARAAADERQAAALPASAAGTARVRAARDRKMELYRRAAEALEQLAEFRRRDETAAVDTLWRAIDAYESAGDAAEAARLLEQLVSQRPNSTRRVTAMLRLGKLRQSARAYRSAVEAYERVLREYPRTQDALQSLVPLATCLMALGGDSTRKAEGVLLKIVDESPNAEPLFDPRAPEYGDALFKLGELYYGQHRNEDAITRLEAFTALYPEDARNVTVRFMLADAYHRSGTALMADREKISDADARARVEGEARTRISRGAALFAKVVTDLGRDPDTARGRADEAPSAESVTRACLLRSAWLNRGDCLFDLGDYAAARDVYAEAAWRFDNDLTAVTASIQLVHCYRRLGAAREGRAALERLRWLVGKMPEAAFAERPGAASRGYWLATVDRMIDAQIH